MRDKLPADLSPVNLLAYIINAFGACGCSEFDELIKSIIRLLEWAGSSQQRLDYDKLYPEAGTYYLLIGHLDILGLVEHGTSIRCPWLTPDGVRLLKALKTISTSDIENASGTAYDGLDYGPD